MDQVLSTTEAELSKTAVPKYKRNRELAIEYYLEGHSPTAISEKVGISTRSVQRYLKEYIEKGRDHFFTKRTPGNSNRLTQDQQQNLDHDLKQSPQHFNFAVATWSPPLLSIHLKEKFGISLSLEACRLLLRDRIDIPDVKPNRTTLLKIEQGFKATINQLVQKQNTEVWLFGQFYLGFRAAYKTKNKNEKKRAIVFCAQQYKGIKQVCQLANPYRDKKEQWTELVNKAVARSEQEALHFFFPKAQIHKYVANRYVKKTEKTLVIEYFPEGLSTNVCWDKLKEKIIHAINLPIDNTENKTLEKHIQEKLKVYLNKLSTT
jgi:transposase